MSYTKDSMQGTVFSVPTNYRRYKQKKVHIGPKLYSHMKNGYDVSVVKR